MADLLAGKGIWIWKIKECENGDPKAIAILASQASFSHVILKVADGVNSYNVDSQTSADLVGPVVQALKTRKIHVWGWHYVYGYDPTGEAVKAIEQVKKYGLEGYAIDAEAEYKEPGKAKAARAFMDRLRSSLPNLPVALCSYRYPSYHPQLPWKEFLEKCDYNMPQLYWMKAHNPAEQLRRSITEFQSLIPYRPVIPVGSAFTQSSWSPLPSEVIEFLKAAQTLNMSAANFYEWSNCRRFLPGIWDTIAGYNWTEEPTGDMIVRYFAALNSHNPEEVVRLYAQNGVHVTSNRTIQGPDAVRNWYQSIFNSVLPEGVFSLVSKTGEGGTYYITWTATSPNGKKVENGGDTIGLVDGKIAYHYTFFNLT